MKILHTADWHLGKRLQEYSRIEEQKEVLDEIIAIADREAIDLVLLAGDIFDSFNPSHEAVELLFKTLRRLSNNGKRPIIAISGNHDSTQFVEAPDPLAREMGIFFYSRYDSVIPVGKFENGIEVLQSESGFMELRLSGHDFPIRIILAPYANETLLKTYLGEEDREQQFRTLLADKWQDLANQYCDPSGINLFIGHFFFTQEGEPLQQEPESERPILHIGGTQALFTADIPSQIQYAALGHLHRYQAVSKEPFPVVYSSSPLAYSFSEADQQKQVVVIELTPGSKPSYSPIGLKKGKPLFRKTFSNLQDCVEWLENNPECYVELTYETESSIDADTRKAIMKVHHGIVSLIPKISNPGSVVNLGIKSEDLEKDMGSLFSQYYESQKGLQPNEELLQIFKEIISHTDDTH
ncbi:metallophosphoesterase family protein [Arthrospiribacter ruber]|uniref:Nuclease SbcCD subunit D n=1 Tax=Arthrospiribacter ruber TaxID=2487934 RepID=A0A951MBT7_9BACT|nr:exonuclease SbcCD subunit D [Arthrospiribacter ruber]MBW3468806.1 exonuclease SbcCD subunit D [Arthrospiribacter ruber]